MYLAAKAGKDTRHMHNAFEHQVVRQTEVDIHPTFHSPKPSLQFESPTHFYYSTLKGDNSFLRPLPSWTTTSIYIPNGGEQAWSTSVFRFCV